MILGAEIHFPARTQKMVAPILPSIPEGANSAQYAPIRVGSRTFYELLVPSTSRASHTPHSPLARAIDNYRRLSFFLKRNHIAEIEKRLETYREAIEEAVKILEKEAGMGPREIGRYFRLREYGFEIGDSAEENEAEMP